MNRPPLLGFSIPLHRHDFERRLTRTLPLAKLAGASDKQVPPSWFRTTATVFSARRSRACCIPLPILGFAAFLVRSSLAPEPLSGLHCPRDANRTLQRIPLADSRTASPQSFSLLLLCSRARSASTSRNLADRTGAPIHRSGPPRQPPPTPKCRTAQSASPES